MLRPPPRSTRTATLFPSTTLFRSQLRILEAMLFAAAEPVDEKALRDRMPDGADVKALLEELRGIYANRGVHLLPIGKGWAFRTAEDLAPYLRIENVVARRMSRAAVETLAIIAYHQPITRAEIEEMRGVALSRGTLDLLLEVGWIRPRGRRRSEERRVGKEGVRTCRSRWSPSH